MPPMVEMLQQPTLRRFYALSWAILITVTLLQSSGQPVVGPPAPPGPPTIERELFLTSGHIAAFAVMMVLLWWALHPAPYAILAALITCLIFGAITEIAQALVPDRSVSLADLLVNWVVSGFTALILYWGEQTS